ncbi:MAG: SDR family NAD(P)-dependent oxidoreductase, partial [Rhodococcus sp. (in: high G+C Gram-positive bacteria)]
MTKWTAEDVVDQTGRTFVVTGANSGLGEVVARALGKAGADVVLACRDTTKADVVAAEIGSNAVVRKLDRSDLSSVRAFAEATEKVDVLVNNAGVMA